MVLTEAFAAGTPVIASNIAGYADVVTDRHDGILVPPADPQSLAEELQALSVAPARLAEMGEAARESAQRYAWPLVASRVEGVYERAIATPEPATGTERVSRRLGLVPADGAAPGSRAAAPVARPRPRGSRRQPSDRAPGRDRRSRACSASASP